MGITTLIIDFHGGEPMLQPRIAFDDMCSVFKSHLADKVNLLFAMQTNGTLVTDEWVDMLAKHDVCVGVSCDGTRESHDLHRVDHNGKGSFDRMLDGLRMLQDAHWKKKIQYPGLLCVINPKFNGRFLYNYFRKELGVTYMDFMFPNVTYETSTEDPEQYGRFLCELFEAWGEEDNAQVKVRILESTLELMLGKNSILSTSGPLVPNYETITISSAGDLGPDDALRSAHPSFLITGKTVQNTSLKDLLNLPVFNTFNKATEQLPKLCQSCCWQRICKGGHILHRYKHTNGFDNPSLMCSALKQFYGSVAHYVLSNGVSRKQLEDVLFNHVGFAHV